jgi:hypothetical protein
MQKLEESDKSESDDEEEKFTWLNEEDESVYFTLGTKSK